MELLCLLLVLQSSDMKIRCMLYDEYMFGPVTATGGEAGGREGGVRHAGEGPANY